MSLDLSNIKGLKDELDEAVRLIVNNPLIEIKASTRKSRSLSNQVEQTESLLTRCADIADSSNKIEKPTLRILHHFACSGGTLISKCIAAMPNIYVLSEAHPLSVNHISGKPKYSPTDITTLARYANVPNADLLAKRIFTNNILETEAFLSQGGGELVLREHSHIDFCLGESADQISVVEDCLKEHFNIKHLITVRNPVDAYMSLSINGWIQFSPPSFDEYCKRLIEFIERYPIKNIIKYEDFVQNPDKQMRKVCSLLHIEFDERYRDFFGIFIVTGDSGRKSDDIAMRKRRPIDKPLLNEIKHSKNFKKVAKMLKYGRDY